MDTILTIINVAITVTALILCFRAWRGLRAVSKPQPRAGYKHSALERRRKSLELATKEWNRKLSRGHIFLAGEQKHLVDQLEREVAALEDELSAAAEEAAPKPEAPKLKHVTTVRRRRNEAGGLRYEAQCVACGWSRVSFSMRTSMEKSVEHEMRYS